MDVKKLRHERREKIKKKKHPPSHTHTHTPP
jgi:hypothetical protein